jgi:putative flippase GtrA
MLAECSQFIVLHKKSLGFFVLVGGLSALVNFGVFGLLWNVFNVNYLIATVGAYLLALAFHFMCNRRFTFQSHGANFFIHLKKYLALVVLNLSIAMLAMHFVVKELNFTPYLGIASGIVINVWIGYLVSRFWVFKTTGKIIKTRGV